MDFYELITQSKNNVRILLKKWQNIPLWHKDYFELNALKKMTGARRMF